MEGQEVGALTVAASIVHPKPLKLLNPKPLNPRT